MKDASLILIIIGSLLAWTGLTGRLGAILAAVFEPSRLVGA